MIFLKILLWPFSILYGAIAAYRNYLYTIGWSKSYELPVAVICVGNLKAGGTGKTPFTQFLLKKFASIYPTAVLSRGYGRKTKGFVLAHEYASAIDIGDEPLQLFTHAQGHYHVAVCEDRVAGVNQLLQLFPDLKLVILDDGFQHRRIKRDINILLTEYKDPFYDDLVLPAGRLREFRGGASRADMIVVTKSSAHFQPLDEKLFYQYTGNNIPIHYTAIQYGSFKKENAVEFGNILKKVILITGIANPLPLLEYLKFQNIEIIEHIGYKDHHTYSKDDLLAIEELRRANTDIRILTTEKDWVKIVPLLKAYGIENTWLYIPIDILMQTDEEKMVSVIQTKITERLNRLTNLI